MEKGLASAYSQLYVKLWSLLTSWLKRGWRKCWDVNACLRVHAEGLRRDQDQVVVRRRFVHPSGARQCFRSLATETTAWHSVIAKTLEGGQGTVGFGTRFDQPLYSSQCSGKFVPLETAWKRVNAQKL